MICSPKWRLIDLKNFFGPVKKKNFDKKKKKKKKKKKNIFFLDFSDFFFWLFRNFFDFNAAHWRFFVLEYSFQPVSFVCSSSDVFKTNFKFSITHLHRNLERKQNGRSYKESQIAKETISKMPIELLTTTPVMIKNIYIYKAINPYQAAIDLSICQGGNIFAIIR